MTSEEKKEYMRKYYQEHKDKYYEYNKKRYKKLKELYGTTYNKKHYEEHKEEMYKCQLEYRRKNAKRMVELTKKYRHERVERLRSEGCTNAWAVVVKGAKPKYKNDEVIS